MSGFSNAALDAMGFRDGQTVEATFHSVNVYALSCVQCSRSTVEDAAGKTASGNPYRIAIGFSVNEGCKRLVGDTLVEDEAEWAKNHQCSAPYLLVEVSTVGAKRVGRVKDEGPSLTTYEMFSAEKAALSQMESDVLPRAVLAVSQLLEPTGTRSVVARHVSREVFGLTPESRPVHDIRLSFSGTGTVSRNVHDETVRVALEEASKLAQLLDPKVASFIRLATDESDLLRRFLFFFLAVEIETHRTFAAIDHASKAPALLDKSLPNYGIAAAFLEGQPERLKTLKDRFTWCAMFAWPGMTMADVADFAGLKSVRDKLSHGEISAPPPHAVSAVEALALKLQRYRIPAEVLSRVSTRN